MKGNPRMNKKIVVVILIVISSFLPFINLVFHIDSITQTYLTYIGTSFFFLVLLIQGIVNKKNENKIENVRLYSLSFCIPSTILFLIKYIIIK